MGNAHAVTSFPRVEGLRPYAILVRPRGVSIGTDLPDRAAAVTKSVVLTCPHTLVFRLRSPHSWGVSEVAKNRSIGPLPS